MTTPKTISLDELFEQEDAAQRAYRETPEGKAENARLAAKLAERIAKGGAEDLLAPMDEEDEDEEDEE